MTAGVATRRKARARKSWARVGHDGQVIDRERREEGEENGENFVTIYFI